MRYPILLWTALLIACDTAVPTPPSLGQQQPEVSAAFQDNSTLKEIISRDSYGRSNGDVVETMFAEELERDTALAHLFERMRDAQGLLNDSAEQFHRIRANDDAFYLSAHPHAQQLSDTLERKRMNDRLDASSTKGSARFKEWERIETAAGDLGQELGQLHTLVMLERTLVRKEDYQRIPITGKTGMSQALTQLRSQRDQLRAELH